LHTVYGLKKEENKYGAVARLMNKTLGAPAPRSADG
jgi:hypothetical protein